MVTVVMATRGRAESFRRAVDSIASQSYPYWRLLVVDDGSGADCQEAKRAYLASLGDNRVTFCPLPASVGPCEARNYGLTRATTEYVGYADDDDVMTPGYLERVFSAVGVKGVEDKSVDLVLTGYTEAGDGWVDEVLPTSLPDVTSSVPPQILH